MVVGYKRPDNFQKDDPVFDVIQLVAFEREHRAGCTATWCRRRVWPWRRRRSGTYPSGRYPCTFVFLMAPAQGHTVEEDTKALDEMLKRLQTEASGRGGVEPREDPACGPT